MWRAKELRLFVGKGLSFFGVFRLNLNDQCSYS